MASAARRWSSSLEWPAAPPAGGGGGRGPLAPPSVSFGHARGEGSMKVEWRREPNSRAVLDVELPPEEVSRAVEAAHRRLAQRVAIPGFRRGKAPRAILERYVGRESLIDETLKLLLPDGYTRAVQEAGLAPIGQPEIDLQTEEVDENAPLRFTASVDLAPEVDPGAYPDVRVPREEPAVTEADVDARIEDLRLRHATLVPTGDAAAARGDFVLVQVLETAPSLPRLQAGKEYLVESGGGGHPAPPGEGPAGPRRGERRAISLGNSEETVGVVAVDIKRRELPVLDDAFAKQVGAETVEALRGQLRERLQAQGAARGAGAPGGPPWVRPARWWRTRWNTWSPIWRSR